MEVRIPKKGDIYRHFKGNLYEVVIIARDSETLEEKVVYKEVNGDAAYVRSLPMFVSPVDKEKYPNVTQEFRFQLVEEATSKSPVKEIEGEVEDKCPTEIMEFLELDEVSDKIKYLQNVKDRITDNFIEFVAHSLDFTEKDGSLMERYEAILKYLKTVEKYERGRLR